MGVRGLLKYIRTHPDTRQRVSLATTAEKVIQKCGKRRAELICDFLNIVFWLLQLFHECKVKSKEYSPYSSFYGGDLNDYAERFLQFVKALRYLNIEPIFFLDNSCDIIQIANAGLASHGHQLGLHRYLSRHRNRMEVVENCSDVITYKPTQDMEVVKKWLLPPLLLIQIQMALAREHAENITLVRCKRDADSEIALYAHENHIKVCGILSGDTDMVIIRQCRVFHCKFFDRDDILGLRKPQLNSKPNDVICEMITPESLAASLGIRPHDLKNLSVLTGNDYTQHLNRDLEVYEKLQLTPPFVEAAATWLKSNRGELLDHPDVAQICLEHPEYRTAISVTYRVYDECRQPRPLVAEVKGQLEHAVHFRTDVVEVLNKDEPCIGDMLLPIRKIIYKLKGLQAVTEHGRTKGEPYMEIKVPVSHPDSSLPKTKTHLERLVCFFSLVTKARDLQDTALSKFTFPQIPPGTIALTCNRLFKPLLLCAPLLFLLSLGELSATLTTNAKDALLVGCLTCYAGIRPCKVYFRPSPQAINISVWFACALRHAYQMATTLGLADFLPLPSEIYQQAAYIPYHYIASVSEKAIKQQLKTLRELAETHAIFYNSIELCSFKVLKTKLDSIGSSCDFGAIAGLAEAFRDAVGEIEASKASGALFQSGKQMKR